MYKPAHHYSMQKPYASLNLTNKFPEDIECIIRSSDTLKGSLFISNIEAAENISTLQKHRITAIMSCAKGYELKHPLTAVPHYKYIPTLDKDQCDISIHFDQAADFITKHLAHTNVLVHCIAGVSRSVSMVLAYFIREHDMGYHQAYTLVKSRRKIIHPNDGFIRQLKAYSQRKTQEKRRESSPPSYKFTPTHSKQYQKDQDLQNYQSTQLLEDSRKPKEVDNYVSTYKSTQLSPNKTDYKSSSKYQVKMQNQPIYRASPTFYTPNKPSYPSNPTQTQKFYQANYKTQNLNRYPSYQKPQNAEAAEPTKQELINEEKKISNNAVSEQQPSKGVEDGRKHRFEQMNRQLNQKIELIRQKYENQRKKLYQRYQQPTKNYQNITSPRKNNATLADPQSDYRYATALERKRVSLTVDRLNQHKEEFIRSPTMRDDRTNAQIRDFSPLAQTRDRVGYGMEIDEIYNRKFQNVYTSKSLRGYKNQYKMEKEGRAANLVGRGYNDYSHYNFDYSFRRY